jgi:hypothetical protein
MQHQPIVIEQRSGPNLLIRALYFIVFPQGEKGEFGRPDAKNEIKNAEASRKTHPFKNALVLWKRSTPVQHAGSSGI